MYFDYSEEHEMLRDSSRRFLQRDDPLKLLRSQNPSDRQARRRAWKSAAIQGWAAMLVSDDKGGTGGTLVDAMVVGEELGRAGFGGPFPSSNAAAWAIEQRGTAGQRDLLPAIALGELLVTWGASESAGGWNMPKCGLAAEACEGGYLLRGEIRLVPDADIANFLLVPARYGAGVVQFLVPPATPGISMRPCHVSDRTRFYCDVTFAGAKISAASLLGKPVNAKADIQEQLRIATVLASADSVGSADRLLEMTVAYTKERVAFGKPVAAFQAVKHRAADMLVQVEAARVATWNAAVRTRDGASDCDEAVSIAKFYATSAAAEVAGQALQLHGGIGFTWEHDLHFFLKRIKANEAIWGTNAWHRERVACAIGV